LLSNEQTLVSASLKEQPKSGRKIRFLARYFSANQQAPNKTQFLRGFCLVLLNTCMNKYKNLKDDALTADWLRDNGLNEKKFSTTHIRLLQAQQQATQILNHHGNLLTNSQRKTLECFQHQMAHKNTRIKLKPTAAFPVLNISTKINRQLFKQHKSLTQASN